MKKVLCLFVVFMMIIPCAIAEKITYKKEELTDILNAIMVR